MADDWHCKQIPSGENPIVVCERESLRAEIERLQDERNAAYAEASLKGYRLDVLMESFDLLGEKLEAIRYAGDNLIKVMKSGSDSGWDDAIDEWTKHAG